MQKFYHKGYYRTKHNYKSKQITICNHWQHPLSSFDSRGQPFPRPYYNNILNLPQYCILSVFTFQSSLFPFLIIKQRMITRITTCINHLIIDSFLKYICIFPAPSGCKWYKEILFTTGTYIKLTNSARICSHYKASLIRLFKQNIKQSFNSRFLSVQKSVVQIRIRFRCT